MPVLPCSKNEVYEMDWVHKDGGKGIGLDRFIVAVGPLAGPIGSSHREVGLSIHALRCL